jgi:hypothetical protein
MSATISRDDWLVILEAVSRDAEKLKLKSDARFQGGHEEFCRELSRRLVRSLAESGFAWARVPMDGDGLYRVLVEAIDNVGGSNRFGLTSDDPQVRLGARYYIADNIEDYLRRTRTAVVRRKPEGTLTPWPQRSKP